jgi:hypothetical protein
MIVDDVFKYIILPYTSPSLYTKLLRVNKTFNNYCQEGAVNDEVKEAIRVNNAIQRDLFNNIWRNEEGHAEIFCRLIRYNTVFTSDNECYVFNDKNKLWEEQDGYLIKMRIVPILVKFLMNIKKRCEYTTSHLQPICITDSDIRDHPTIMAQITLLIKKLSLYAYHERVYNIVKNKLYNHNFISQLNRDEDCLPIKNNLVINLRTGLTRKRTIKDIYSFECPVSLIKTDFKHATKFMLGIMDGNVGIMNYFQKCLGYCMTGHTKEKCLFLWFGKQAGRNGTSTVKQLMRKILSGYCEHVPISVFYKDKYRLDEPRLTGLQYSRFGHHELYENPEKMYGKKISYSNQSRYECGYDLESTEPQTKLILHTGYKLKVIDIIDEILVHKIIFIPFNACFTGKTKDTAFVDTLFNEHLDEVFTWLVEGSKRWYKEGLGNKPQILVDSIKEYMESCNN